MKEYTPDKAQDILATCVIALLHLILLLLVKFVPHIPEIKVIHIESLRNVGEKQGVKDTIALNPFDEEFDEPDPNQQIQQGNPRDSQQVKEQEEQQEKQVKDFTMDALKLPQNEGIGPQEQTRKQRTRMAIRGIDLPAILNQPMTPALRTLSKSDVAVHFVIPEGVSEDELNKLEEVFYGFRRRTFVQYVNSVLSNISRYQRNFPHLPFPPTRKSLSMGAYVTIDSEGNIIRIKTSDWVDIDTMQTLFDQSLQDMERIPNPPRALLDDRNELTIHFRLNVN